MSRRGIAAGVVGGVAAAGAAGVVTAGTRQHRAIGRLKERAQDQPAEFGPQRSDRAGSVTASDGVGLFYEEVGPANAPLTAVFVHGYTLALGSWWFQRRDLAARFGDELRMVFYDQRSHGRSSRSSAANSTIDQLGDDLAAVIAARAPRGPLVLVGHSMGGMTLMALADRDPELFGAGGRVRGVAFVASSSGNLAKLTLGLPGIVARLQTPVLGAALWFARWQAALVERGRRIGTDIAWTITQRLSFDDPDVDPALIAYVNDMISSTRIDVIADFAPTLFGHDKASALAAMADTDVEVMCGDKDVMLPRSHSKAIAEALPHAHLTIVEGAGHMLQLEKPDVVDDLVGGLIERSLHPATQAAG